MLEHPWIKNLGKPKNNSRDPLPPNTEELTLSQAMSNEFQYVFLLFLLQ